MSQETEKEECPQPSPKRIRRNLPTEVAANEDLLDEDEEALARSLPPVINSRSTTVRRVGRVDSDEEDQSQDQERERHDKTNECGCLLLL